MISTKQIIIALDTSREDEALRLIRELKPQINFFKIGLELFCSAGPHFILRLKEMGLRVFLDLKFHDIPRTTAAAAAAVLKLGVDMLNVHISGGGEMLEQTVQRVKSLVSPSQPRPLLIGVTVLTSLDEVILSELGVNRPLWQQAEELAVLGKLKGLDGVVASPREARRIRERCGDNFLIITPGIRPAWADKQDQKRTLTPLEALKSGADYLVIGSPVTASASPREALERLLDEGRS